MSKKKKRKRFETKNERETRSGDEQLLIAKITVPDVLLGALTTRRSTARRGPTGD